MWLWSIVAWAGSATRQSDLEFAVRWGRIAVLRASIWIEAEDLRDFERAGTDAHRLCTYSDGWVERFAADVLVSYKNEVARDRLTTELALWALGCNFKLGGFSGAICRSRMPNAMHRALLLGDSTTNLQSVDLRTLLRYGIDFGSGLFRRVLYRSAGQSPVCPSCRAEEASQLFRLHLFVFRRRGELWRYYSEYRSFEKVARAWAGKFCAQ